MELDPFLAAKVHLLGALTRADLTDPDASRRFAEYSVDPAPWVPPDVAVADRTIDGPHGEIPIRVYSPPADPTTLLVWLHGGGFANGDLDMPESHVVASELAARAGAIVVAVGYRLARDGVRYPVPVDDAEAAWQWAVELGVPGSYALGGASAGAAIALGVALRQRAPSKAPHRLLLAYPFVHFPVPALDDATADVMRGLPPLLRFPPEAIEDMVRNYVGRISNVPAEAMPGAADLTALPPTTIVLSELDDLRSSGDLLASQLKESGVTVSVSLGKGMPHGHLNRSPSLSEVDTSLEFFADALRASGGPMQEAGQLLEHGPHVHLVRIEQPLQLKTVGGGDHQAGCALWIQRVREFACGLFAADVRRDVRAKHLVAVDEELPCRTRRVCAFGRHRDVQPDQAWFHGVVLDDLDQAVDGDVMVDRLIVEAAVAFVATAKHLDEELLLGAEMMKEAGLAQADEASYLAERGAIVSLAAEQLERDVDDLSTLGFAFRIRSTSCHGDRW
jgi:acetyl esterase